MKKYVYLQAKEEIMHLLKKGELTNNEKVFSERKISKKINYSRSSVRRAIRSLVEDGVLYRTDHYNSNLYFKKTDSFLLEVGDNSSNSLTQDLKIKGMPLKDKIISFKLVDKTFSSDFSKYSTFYELIRKRSCNNEVFSLQKAYIPFRLFENAHRYNFSEISLYNYMEFKGNKPIFFKKKLQFIKPTEELKEYLKINNDSEIYFFEYYGYNKDNLLVEYTQSYFKSDSIKINLSTIYDI